MLEVRITGIDFSHWQGNPDETKMVKDGYSFLFHKATDGLSGIDNQYVNNMPNILALDGIVAGSYHFYEPIGNRELNGDAQANHFLDEVLSVIGKEKILDTVLILDFEKYGVKPDDISDMEGTEGDLANAELFMATVIKRLSGELELDEEEIKSEIKLMIYSYHQFTSQCNISSDSILVAPFMKWWVARYGKHLPAIPAGASFYIWQNSDSGKVAGLSGAFDTDIVMCTNEEWKNWINSNKFEEEQAKAENELEPSNQVELEPSNQVEGDDANKADKHVGDEEPIP